MSSNPDFIDMSEECVVKLAIERHENSRRICFPTSRMGCSALHFDLGGFHPSTLVVSGKWYAVHTGCCWTLRPPSTVRHVAFMKGHSSEIMNRAAIAISFGDAMRPPG